MSGTADGRYAPLFRNANYVRVFGAGLGSVAGSAIASVCLVWLVAVRTGSALDVGALAAAAVGASLVCSVFGGTLVDRYDRRRLMIASDAVRAVAMGAVAVELLFGRFNLPSLLGAYAVVGAFTVVFNPAEQALVPRLVPGAAVADASGLVRSSRSALQFVGTALGGVLLVSVGAAWGVAANAATFVLSAALLTGMPLAPESPRPPGTVLPSYFADLADGFRWLRRATGFLQLTLSATVFNFCWGVVGTFFVFFATRNLHADALEYAILLGMEVAGSAVGALLVGRTGAVRWTGLAWTVPYGALCGGVVVVLAAWPSFALAAVALLLLGALAGFAGTAWLSGAQLLVPTEMQGRYFGVDALGSAAILPVAQLAGALVVSAWGARTTFLVIGALWVVGGLLFLLPRELRQLGYRPEAPTTLRTDAAAAGTSGSLGGTRGG